MSLVKVRKPAKDMRKSKKVELRIPILLQSKCCIVRGAPLCDLEHPLINTRAVQATLGG